jgi:crotonobetainyl-CoA:carnitine CoA-transferase CaiB-like acyl-CoA transferase
MGAMDSLSQAISGLSSLSGDPAGRGERTRTPILDFVSAFVTAEAAMVGLAARRRSGRATRVDTSQMSAALDAAAPQVAASAGGPVAPAGRAGRRRAFGGWFECADGRFVSIECRDADEVGRVAEALGVAAGDGAVGPAIVRALAAMPADAALDRLRGVGLDAHAVVRRFHPDVFEAWPGAVGAVHDERVGEIRHPQTPFVFDVTGARAGAPLGPIGRDNPLIGALIAAWQARSPAPATPERPDAP